MANRLQVDHQAFLWWIGMNVVSIDFGKPYLLVLHHQMPGVRFQQCAHLRKGIDQTQVLNEYVSCTSGQRSTSIDIT